MARGPGILMISPSHLYLHVPFCRELCPYCDYPVVVGDTEFLTAWGNRLRSERALRVSAGLSLSGLDTVMVGGGTPSALGTEVMQAARSVVGEDPLRTVVEWTGEANPEHINPALLEGWRRAGVTRVNIGIQSLNAAALQWLGRSHDPDQAVRAMKYVARTGLPSWSVDLLFGLPEEVDPNPLASLPRIVDLGVPHISLYELVLEPKTPLGRRAVSGELTPCDEDRRADQFLELTSALSDAGYEHYELTGFALPGHRCRHTQGCLEGGSWLGLGPGAHSCLEGEWAWNLADWGVYSKAVDDGAVPSARSSPQGDEEARLERIRLRLRLADGLSQRELGPTGRRATAAWVRAGFAHPDPERVRLTAEGWLRLDGLALELADVERDVDGCLNRHCTTAQNDPQGVRQPVE